MNNTFSRSLLVLAMGTVLAVSAQAGKTLQASLLPKCQACLQAAL